MIRWFLLPLLGFFAGDLAAGNRAYREGDAREAAAEYRQAIERGDETPLARGNLGAALLRAGEFEEALPHLAKAGAGSPEVRQRAAYHEGNASLLLALRDSASDVRVPRLRRAIASYRRALLLDPGDADARWNLEIAQRLLERDARSGEGGKKEDGGGENRNDPIPPPPTPPPPADRDPGGTLSRAEAERLLAEAERSEQQVQRKKLRKRPVRRSGGRDW